MTLLNYRYVMSLCVLLVIGCSKRDCPSICAEDIYGTWVQEHTMRHVDVACEPIYFTFEEGKGRVQVEQPNNPYPLILDTRPRGNVKYEFSEDSSRFIFYSVFVSGRKDHYYWDVLSYDPPVMNIQIFSYNTDSIVSKLTILTKQ